MLIISVTCHFVTLELLALNECSALPVVQGERGRFAKHSFKASKYLPNNMPEDICRAIIFKSIVYIYEIEPSVKSSVAPFNIPVSKLPAVTPAGAKPATALTFTPLVYTIPIAAPSLLIYT